MPDHTDLQQSSSIEFVEPEKGKLFTYCNNIVYGFTPGDVRLVLGELIDFEKGKATVEQRVQVTFAWVQVKQLALVLAKLVQSHEQEYGEIKLPADKMSQR